jgi:hypothetical protein
VKAEVRFYQSVNVTQVTSKSVEAASATQLVEQLVRVFRQRVSKRPGNLRNVTYALSVEGVSYKSRFAPSNFERLTAELADIVTRHDEK